MSILGILQEGVQWKIRSRRRLSYENQFIGSALAITLLSGGLPIPAFAASNPADDASTYSYTTGKQSYETHMAECHEWFDNVDGKAATDYSFNAGTQAAPARDNAFKPLPSGDEVADEEMDMFYQSSGIGEGSVYEGGFYDEAAHSTYGYGQGRAATQQRHASYTAIN